LQPGWDPVDPFNPWPTDRPYEPEPEECTTTSADECSTGYVVSGDRTSTISSCSVIYGCSAEPSSTVVGTQTLAPWATFSHGAAPTADPGEAYTSSFLASVESELSSSYWYYFPTTTTPAAPTATVPHGGVCTKDEQCSGDDCMDGERPGCRVFGAGRDSTCSCFDMDVPIGAECSKHVQCRHDCGDGSYSGCMFHGSGWPSTCVCGYNEDPNRPKDVELGGICVDDEQCTHGCPDGKYAGCLYFGGGQPRICTCLNNN
jgi:hypothetical protein